ncbi:MAG: UDP-3-O-(3-hydroxymyristoyl)glucosamine N-acyltransferase [Verrucomicrobiota bacterium]|nr:UDP-3-O-(3-hydroxymyristoyl)glucosamine N-acyltransferase [Verrucomicrobiota bacterium]
MEFRVAEVVALAGGTLVAGDETVVLTGVETLEEACPGDLSFFGVAKYRAQFDATRAGAVLVTPDVDSGPEGVALIQVENPSYALAALVKKAEELARAFTPGIRPGSHVSEHAQVDPGAAVHPGAVVEDGAVIGSGSEVCAGAVIGRGVQVGEDCVIYQNASVREGCILGDRVILQPGAVIGSDGFGYEFSDDRHQKVPQLGIVVLENDVEIGANACVDRARIGRTVVGEGSKIDNLVQIGHNVQIGKHCILVALSGVAGSSKLQDHVTVAAQAGINGHIEIASGVQLGGRSSAFQSITEPGAYMGTPAKPLKEEIRIWRELGRLQETRQEVKALRKELDELKES